MAKGIWLNLNPKVDMRVSELSVKSGWSVIFPETLQSKTNCYCLTIASL